MTPITTFADPRGGVCIALDNGQPSSFSIMAAFDFAQDLAHMLTTANTPTPGRDTEATFTRAGDASIRRPSYRLSYRLHTTAATPKRPGVTYPMFELSVAGWTVSDLPSSVLADLSILLVRPARPSYLNTDRSN